jgi:drug/metabolite transporter (DMT)-like permease
MTGKAATGPDNLRGAFWLALAMMVLTAETALLRLADTAVPISTYMLLRSGAQLALGVVLVLSLGEGLAGMRTRRVWTQALRGGSSLISWQLYYYSFRTLDFAVATTLNFTTALFVALFAGPVMGERVGVLRWTATLIGFGGVLLVVRPGGGGDPGGIAAGLVSALLGTVIVFSSRSLGRTDRVETTMFWVGVITFLGALPQAIWSWTTPAPGDAAILALAAAAGAGALWLILLAFRAGEASALAPIQYVRLLFAAVAGWLVFGEVPALWTAAGCAVIVASALVLARAEGRRAG